MIKEILVDTTTRSLLFFFVSFFLVLHMLQELGAIFNWRRGTEKNYGWEALEAVLRIEWPGFHNQRNYLFSLDEVYYPIPKFN